MYSHGAKPMYAAQCELVLVPRVAALAVRDCMNSESVLAACSGPGTKYGVL